MKYANTVLDLVGNTPLVKLTQPSARADLGAGGQVDAAAPY